MPVPKVPGPALRCSAPTPGPQRPKRAKAAPPTPKSTRAAPAPKSTRAAGTSDAGSADPGIAAHRGRRNNRKSRRRKGRKEPGPGGVPEPGESGPTTDPGLDEKGPGPGHSPREPAVTCGLGAGGGGEAGRPLSSRDGPGDWEERRLAIDGVACPKTAFVARYFDVALGEAEWRDAQGARNGPADEKKRWLAICGAAYTKAAFITRHGVAARGEVGWREAAPDARNVGNGTPKLLLTGGPGSFVWTGTG